MSADVRQVAQEIQFAKALASNNKTLRRRALKRLKKWLLTRSTVGVKFNESNCMRLWRGLIYCVWMSDKPLVQEETVDDICSLIFSFNNVDDAFLFIKCYYTTISEFWMGLDLHRLDKFMMLARRFLRASFQLLKKHDWDSEIVSKFASGLYQGLKQFPPGLVLHTTDVYLEELAKVGGEDLTPDVVLSFLDPWFLHMAINDDNRLAKAMRENIFLYLIKQSDLGIEHNVKFEVWKSIGFPGGDLSVMDDGDSGNEDVSEEDEPDDEEDGGKTALDPRAGCVDTVLPSLPFDPEEIIAAFELSLKSSDTSIKARKTIKNLIERFKTYTEGKYPLGIHKVDLPEEEDLEDEVERAAEDLISLETKTYVSSMTKKKRVYDYLNLEQASRAKRLKPEWVESEDTECFDETADSLGLANLSSVWEVTIDDESLSKTNESEKDKSSVQSESTQKKSKKRKRNKKKAITKDGAIISANEQSISGLEDISEDDDDDQSFNISEVDCTESDSSSTKKKAKKRKKNKKQSLESSSTIKESKPNLSTPSKVKLNGAMDGSQSSKELNKQVSNDDASTPQSSGKKKRKKNKSPSQGKQDTINSDGEREITIPALSKLSQDRRWSFPTAAESKRVSFVLNKNLEHGADEYVKSIKNSPSVPYDASKKPYQGVLKHTHLASPINPFFKLNKKNKQKNILM